MLDHTIPKPATLRGYALHRLAAELTGSSKVQFTDCGDHIILRTAKPITPSGKPLKSLMAGDLAAFELTACVGKKTRGKHGYFPPSDWRSRHAWLRRKADQNGFEVVALHCTATIETIDDQNGRRFTVDRTEFAGVLRVKDVEVFQTALASGIGSTARTFGFGMLKI